MKGILQIQSGVNSPFVIKDSSDTIKIVNDDYYWSLRLRNISQDDGCLIQVVSDDVKLYFIDLNQDEVGIRSAV